MSYDPKQDVEDLHTAFQGIGTDEKVVIQILANRTNAQRQQIKDVYKSTYNEDIQERLKSELSGHFEDVSVALFDLPAVYDAKQLYACMKGLGTDEKGLIEIITSRTPEQMEEIKKVFNEMYKKTLEEWVKSEISKEFLDFMLALLKCQRKDVRPPDKQKCKDLGNKLAQKEKLEWEGEGSDLYNAVILCGQAELTLICKYFHKYKQKTIIEAVDKDFSSDLKKAIKSTIFAVVSPSEFCATAIHDALEGLGTNDKVLMRMLITRDEIDLPLIKAFYKKKYNKDMIEDIKSDCSGDYKNILVELASH